MRAENNSLSGRKCKLLSIVGARPQIIKSAALSRAIKNGFSDSFEDIILHTGQHYDQNMSDVFFSEMGIPKPQYNLNVGSGSHGMQTAKMIQGIEEVILELKPDAVVVYGDTNSTIAGAVAASKLKVPVVHIEAGLRSFNKTMPEEINRVVCDHTSTMLFSPTRAGMKNLEKEGFFSSDGDECVEMDNCAYSIDNPGVFHTGDIMYDNSLHFAEIAGQKAPLEGIQINNVFKDNAKENVVLKENSFILATIHRDNNTDNPVRLKSIFKALYDLGEKYQKTIVCPLHPRTAKILETTLDKPFFEKIVNSEYFKLTEPASFFEMTTLERNAELIITDSGGVQKEAYFFKKPSLILRPTTEWIEIVENGAAILVDDDYEEILRGYEKIKNAKIEYPPIFGDGNAAENILGIMKSCMKHKFTTMNSAV